MTEEADPYEVQSPWGAVAAFFLVQCFGFVVLHGFRMFVHIGLHGSDSLSIFNAHDVADRIFLPLWGLMWVFAFVLFEADMFYRIAAFWRENRNLSLLRALRAPRELLRAILAVVFASAFFAIAFGQYPFPSRPISTSTAVGFWMIGWGAASLIAWGMRNKLANKPATEQAGRGGLIITFVMGATFFILTYCCEPGLFYFHGMLGLGVMTMIMCNWLLKKSKSKDTVDG